MRYVRVFFILISFLVFLFSGFCTPTSAQNLYRWQDEDGTTHYTNNPAALPDATQKPLTLPDTARKPSTQQDNLSSKRWRHSQYSDEMRGTVHKFAVNESTNTLNFSFPYGGPQRGTLIISDRGALFSIKKGQIICHDICFVEAKFDNGDISTFEASASGDDSTVISIGHDGFLKSIKERMTLMLKVHIYREGYPVFYFTLR